MAKNLNITMATHDGYDVIMDWRDVTRLWSVYYKNSVHVKFSSF